jgi:hypothetical protein
MRPRRALIHDSNDSVSRTAVAEKNRVKVRARAVVATALAKLSASWTNVSGVAWVVCWRCAVYTLDAPS